jgi:hypothetical protein
LYCCILKNSPREPKMNHRALAIIHRRPLARSPRAGEPATPAAVSRPHRFGDSRPDMTKFLPVLALIGAAALAGCGHNMEQRAATGAVAGAVVAGPAGAAVGAAAGAATSKAADDPK